MSMNGGKVTGAEMVGRSLGERERMRGEMESSGHRQRQTHERMGVGQRLAPRNIP
jgi:hypothetical protein